MPAVNPWLRDINTPKDKQRPSEDWGSPFKRKTNSKTKKAQAPFKEGYGKA